MAALGRGSSLVKKFVNSIIRAIAVLKLSDSLRKEGYTFSSNANAITIVGADAAGVFYGIQSLLAMLPVELWAEPENSIQLEAIRLMDKPAYAYRGIMLDIARNYNDAEATAKMLRDGWLFTGDFGRLDDAGNLHILSRRMDVVDEIGKYKKDNNITILQLKRWRNILRDRIAPSSFVTTAPPSPKAPRFLLG